MSTLAILFCGLAVYLIFRIFLHKLGKKVDDEAYTAFYLIIFVIVLIMNALHDFSQQSRIYNMQQAQMRICEKQGKSKLECQKIVYFNEK
ncbi:MAG: hypothetical protein AB1465_05435 [Patescibacteria group bacterium]